MSSEWILIPVAMRFFFFLPGLTRRSFWNSKEKQVLAAARPGLHRSLWETTRPSFTDLALLGRWPLCFLCMPDLKL